MNASPRSIRLPLHRVRSWVALGALLVGCGAPMPDEHDVVDDVPSTRRAAPATVPGELAISRGDASISDNRPDRGEVDASSTPVRATCEDLPNLSDPRNGDARETRFALSGLTATRDDHGDACALQRGGDGRDAAVRFTAPSAGPWRLSVDSGITWGAWDLSLLDGCAADASPTRCVTSARSMVVPLQEGQTVTMVVDGCYDARSCSFGVVAERVIPAGHAPEVTRASVYRWSPSSFAVIESHDVDANMELMVIELRAHDGSLVPVGGLLRRELVTQSSASPTELRFELGAVPERAVRARIWAEDASGLRSAVLDVPIKPRPVLATGERCERDASPASCEMGALCTHDRSTGQLCRPRLAAHYDPIAASLRVDLNAAELGMTAAEVSFLDSAGVELARVDRFDWINRSSSYTIDRTPLLARDAWTAPRGLSRVRVTVLNAEGQRVTTLVAPVEAPTVASWRCDPTTSARARCDVGLTCVRTTAVWSAGTCQRRDPGCPSAWAARAWSPTADARVATLDARAETPTWDIPSCFSDSVWSGARLQEDVVSFVAPVAGTYRFALGPRASPDVRPPEFAIVAHRLDCRVDRAAPEIACGRASGSPLTSTLELTASARERILLVIAARGASLDYRLDVAIPNP